MPAPTPVPAPAHGPAHGPAPGSDRDEYLFARLRLIEARVQELVAHRRRSDPAPDDPFRGLYLSDQVIDHLLAPPGTLPTTATRLQQVDTEQDEREAAGEPSRLRRLNRVAELTALDVELLLTALAPDLDPRFERLYGYLNDDVSRRRASIGLALELAGVPLTSAEARARLAPGGPLLDRGLVVLEDADRPFLTRALRVPDRVTAHLLGDDRPDPVLAEVLVPVRPHHDPLAQRLGGMLASGVGLVYLRDRGRRSARATAVAALQAGGFATFVLDLHRLAEAPAPEELARAASREALLTGAGIVGHPVEVLGQAAPACLRALAGSGVPVVLAGDTTWEPAWTRQVPLQADAPQLGPAQRRAIWTAELGIGPEQELPAPIHLQLGPEEIVRAARAASLACRFTGTSPDRSALQRGVREQNASGLERLARRLEPAVGWDDLVLPGSVAAALRHFAARARHRDRVLAEWRMRPGGGRGAGITGLFAGDSGTGKTMAAEVIAGELGLDLYTVDLATVVDKYVGETEKNLERIFAEAGGVNAVLLFDEADAVFGRRSEVRDAHDRYANVESAYLLQRMETFDGVAILATNLRANIDEAFTRRLDVVVDFPLPDVPFRRRLWEQCLGARVPRGDDLDLDFCAEAFELSGGAIRSIVVTAGYLAAERDGPLGMAELITAIRVEYGKLGRLLLEREFGRYLELAREPRAR